ncbi:MAG: hypothetical protein J6S85_07175 [Methanobrevibacter sp.]|nr:hypothetical protein [Methanobrevibacter sp.]
MVDLKDLELRYFCNGYDVPYEVKNGGILNIKPILVKDYPFYEITKGLLEINKNEINDIDIIKMSYLEFIFNLINIDVSYNNSLIEICRLSLGYDKIAIGLHNNKKCLLLCEEDGTVKYIITSKEFDDISKIILNQNDANYDNRYVNPEVKELMAEYYKVRHTDFRTPSLEEKKAYVVSKTGMNINQINDMSYRLFDLIYNSCVSSEIYFAQKMVQCSYKYEVKEDVKHPLFEKKKDPYSEIFEDTSILGNKGITGADKLNELNLSK